jgi:hypothetical protein
MNKQSQKGGENSTNIQAGELTVIQGMTYLDVRQVALDVFKSNFYELAGKAINIASERAEQVTEDFLRKLQIENPDGFAKAQDPDFQCALYTVQKEYAKTGDEDLGGLLVDLLVDRSKQDQRDILQIVLNESLSVAPKLTHDQLACLAVTFLFKYTINHRVDSHVKLGDYFDKMLKPFLENLSKKQSCYQHLEFSGCGSTSIASNPLENILGINYQGLFLKGFDKNEIEKKELSIGRDSRLFIPCLNDDQKIQVGLNSKEMLEKVMDKAGIPNEDKPKIIQLFNLGKMNDQEIKDKCIEIRPYMENVFDTWSDSQMQNLTLTSVGIAIGHANIKRLVGEFSNLSIWIN